MSFVTFGNEFRRFGNEFRHFLGNEFCPKRTNKKPATHLYQKRNGNFTIDMANVGHFYSSGFFFVHFGQN